MDDCDWITYTSLIFGIVGLIVGVVGVLFGRKESKRASDADNKLLDMQKRQSELRILDKIAEAKKYKEQIGDELRKFHESLKGQKMTDEQSISFEILKARWYSATEEWLNGYDKACKWYLEGTIDQTAFKDDHYIELENFFQKYAKDEGLRKALLPRSKSNFNNIWSVISEWGINRP